MWPADQQLQIVAQRVNCTTEAAGTSEHSMLGCLRTKSGLELKQAVIDTGAQFQPVVDNITVFKDYVKQTKEGRTARIPMLIGTNRDEGTLIVEGELTAYLNNISPYIKSNNLNFPWSDITSLSSLYPVPSSEYPTAYNASAAIWRDAHMLCLVHNIATVRSELNFPPVWRYRWDLVGTNLNSRGLRIGAFHGSDIRFVMGTWRTIVRSPPFVPANETQIEISNLVVEAWTNFIKNPSLGPQIRGWGKYDPRDASSLAILGLSTTSAFPGNHTETDKSCAYWNTLLPKFPQTFPRCGNWTCV
jgi:carboxylesterase type B